MPNVKLCGRAPAVMLMICGVLGLAIDEGPLLAECRPLYLVQKAV
jgi:hypothetical protein